MLGVIVMFVFWRIADHTSEKAGFECGYNCDDCKAHCVGYRCHVMRCAIDAEIVAEMESEESSSQDL